eukprot:jgi/Botrbrau1/16248/Bobra.0066s0033.1
MWGMPELIPLAQDVGFNGVWPKLGSDENIINQYFQVYFDQAVNITSELKTLGDDRMIYLTHSWLVSFFLDCPGGWGSCVPAPGHSSGFVEAVQRGDIICRSSSMRGLLEFAVKLTHELDDLLGLPRKVVMSQDSRGGAEDVPGLTRAAIPILHKAGVRGLTVGRQRGERSPGRAPQTPFWWKDEASGNPASHALSSWLRPPGGLRPFRGTNLQGIRPCRRGLSEGAGGYSGNPVDVPGECAHVDGFPHVLCAAWQGDNQGPHPVSEATSRMPQVYGSSYEAFFKLLLEEGGQLRLPRGDGRDRRHLDVAEYRALLRVHKQLWWLAAEPAYRNFTRFLLKVCTLFPLISRGPVVLLQRRTEVPEHTWGPDVKTFLPDFHNWDNPAFHARLEMKESIYMDVTYAWQRQRSYIQWAADAISLLPQGEMYHLE